MRDMAKRVQGANARKSPYDENGIAIRLVDVLARKYGRSWGEQYDRLLAVRREAPQERGDLPLWVR